MLNKNIRSAIAAAAKQIMSETPTEYSFWKHECQFKRNFLNRPAHFVQDVIASRYLSDLQEWTDIHESDLDCQLDYEEGCTCDIDQVSYYLQVVLDSFQ